MLASFLAGGIVMALASAATGNKPGSTTPTPTPTVAKSATPVPTPSAIRIPSPSANPAAGRFDMFPVPTQYGSPYAITVGPDRNLWFTEANNGNKIARITVDGNITEYPLSGPGRQVLSITTGPDGNLWFAELGANRIGRMTPTGKVTEFAGHSAGYPTGITNGPDGKLWYTAASPQCQDFIGRITTAGQISEFKLPGRCAQPRGITTGPDRNLWFTEASGIGSITPNGDISEFPLAPGTGSGMPYDITAGPDGALWFVEYQPQGGDRIGRITTSGQLTEYGLPTQNAGLQAITVGSDGNLWFTEGHADQIGRITPTGVVQEYKVLDYRSQPEGIVTGPDGDIWFTEPTGGPNGAIAHFRLG